MSVNYVFKDMTDPRGAILGGCRVACNDDCDSCSDKGLNMSADGYTIKGVIRSAYELDVPQMRTIYNYEVKNGVATLDVEPRSLEDRMEWYKAHRTKNHPLIIAEVDGIIFGYASLSPYRSKDAYDTTVELSVYVHPDRRNLGVATALMRAILRKARSNENIHNIVSVITSGNETSAKLHKKFGFNFVGTIPQVAQKNGEFLSIDHYYLLV